MSKSNLFEASWLGNVQILRSDNPLFQDRLAESCIFIYWEAVLWGKGKDELVAVIDIQSFTIFPNAQPYQESGDHPFEEGS